jgi:drug/metabolite transporter (DMT)-like permease
MTEVMSVRSVARRGVVLAAISVVVYAMIPIMIALALADGVSLPTLYAGRTVLALGAVWLLGQVLRRRWPTPRAGWPGDRRRLMVLGGSFYCAQMVLYFASLTRLDVAVAGVLAYAYPALVALGGVLMGLEALGARQVVSLVLSLMGIVMVIGLSGAGSMDPLGVTMALGSALAYAFYILTTNALAARVGPLASSFWVLAGATVISAGLFVLLPPTNFPVTVGVPWLLLHGLVLLPVAVTCFLFALATLGPVRLSIFDTLQPAITALAGVLILGERLTWWQVAGAVLILVAAVRAVSGARPVVVEPPMRG